MSAPRCIAYGSPIFKYRWWLLIYWLLVWKRVEVRRSVLLANTYISCLRISDSFAAPRQGGLARANQKKRRFFCKRVWAPIRENHLSFLYSRNLKLHPTQNHVSSRNLEFRLNASLISTTIQDFHRNPKYYWWMVQCIIQKKIILCYYLSDWLYI